MNANDLADRLEEFYSGTHITKAAETLRQQHAEIEALKAGLLSHHDIYPVKELTDEEIADFLYAYCLDIGDVYEASEKQFIKCVRAILRKAQEK